MAVNKNLPVGDTFVYKDKLLSVVHNKFEIDSRHGCEDCHWFLDKCSELKEFGYIPNCTAEKRLDNNNVVFQIAKEVPKSKVTNNMPKQPTVLINKSDFEDYCFKNNIFSQNDYDSVKKDLPKSFPKNPSTVWGSFNWKSIKNTHKKQITKIEEKKVPSYDVFTTLIAVNKIKSMEEYRNLRMNCKEYDLPLDIEGTYPKFESFSLLKMRFGSMPKSDPEVKKITKYFNINPNGITRSVDEFISFAKNNGIYKDSQWKLFKRKNPDKCLGYPKNVHTYYRDFTWTMFKTVQKRKTLSSSITKSKDEFVRFLKDNKIQSRSEWHKFKANNAEVCLGYPRNANTIYSDFSWKDLKTPAEPKKPQKQSMPKDTFMHTIDALNINHNDIDKMNAFIFKYNSDASNKYVIPIDINSAYKL